MRAGQSEANSPLAFSPRLVILFTGHRIDTPDRPSPRFPPNAEAFVAERIGATLDEVSAGPEDLGICGGASGGDLLFAEAALSRKMRVALLIPSEEGRFLRTSVDPAGPKWRERFGRVKEHPSTSLHRMPEGRADVEAESLHTTYTRWELEWALRFGPARVHVIAVWDGRPGDGAGGTADMVELARQSVAIVDVIDPKAAAQG